MPKMRDYIKKFNSIRTKYAIVFTSLIAVISLFIHLYFPAKLEEQAFSELRDKAKVIGYITSNYIASALHNDDSSAVDLMEGLIKSNVLEYYVVENSDHIKVFSSKLNNNTEKYKTAKSSISSDGTIYQHSEPVYYKGDRIGDLYFGISLTRINETISQSKINVTITNAVILLLGIIAVFIMSSVVTGRLSKMVRTAGDIAKGDLSKRTEIYSDDEVGQFGVAFNTMVENLEEVYKELESVNRDLENRVEERTLLLQQEIQEHTDTVEKLYQTETRSRAIINTLPDQMYMFNKEGVCLEFKSERKTDTYFPVKDFVGKNITEIYPEVIASPFFEKMRLTVTVGKPQEFEYQLEFDGELRHFESRFVNTWDDEILVIIREITDRKEAEKAILESEAKFRALAETLPVSIMIVHGNKCIYVNPAAQVSSGYTKEELLSIDFWHFVHADYQDIVKQNAIERLKGNDIPSRYEFKISTKSGEEKWVDFSARIIEFQGKNVILGCATDITDQKMVEEQLRKLSLAVEQSTISVLITDCYGAIEYVNPKFTSVTGYALQEIIGRNPRILKSGLISTEEYQLLWDTIKQGGEWKGEFLNKKKNGELYWDLTSISGIRNQDNKITHFLAIKEDITEKKLVEEKLIQSERDYRGLFENALDGMLIFEPTTALILDANPHASIIFGCKRIELIGKQLNQLALQDELLITTNLKNYEVIHNRKDGTKVYLDVNTTFTHYQGDRAILGIFRDITERKDFENALMKAKEEAEKSDRLKSEFLAQMSHEIRTPINAILSFNSLLKDELNDQVSDDMKQSFRIIDNGGRRLIRTIDLILNMSQIQAGSYEIYPAGFDLVSELLDHIIMEFENIARLKNLSLCLVNKSLNSKVHADHYTVTQIFTNLIDNAIKFTHAGSVKVNVYNADQNKLCVEIADTGVGISEEYLPILFTPFSQEEMGYTRSFEGNGLGLALVKKYADLNDAEIKVSSKKGEGSTFTVYLKTVSF